MRTRNGKEVLTAINTIHIGNALFFIAHNPNVSIETIRAEGVKCLSTYGIWAAHEVPDSIFLRYTERADFFAIANSAQLIKWKKLKGLR